MQDRYAGDIGDFGKIALLNALHDQGLSIGVNWYKTEPLDSEKKANGAYKQNDGGYLIPPDLGECDPIISSKLTKIVADGRSIDALEKAGLISDAVYYNKTVTVNDRGNWHAEAISFFNRHDTNLVFLDPDNGLLVKSVKESNPRSVKYVFDGEIEDYLKNGCSVLIYNHRCRKPELQYFREIEEMLHRNPDKDEIFEITFPRYSVRDYFAIPATAEHAAKIKAAFSAMLTGVWKEKRMCQRPLTAGATFSDYRSRFEEGKTKAFLKQYRSLPEDVVRKMIELDDGNTATKACMFSTWRTDR